MEFHWAISNPKRWCCESTAFNMPAGLENSAVATGLEKVSFHSNPKERQCQKMFKLAHNCTQFTHYRNNAQNSPSQASTACELWTKLDLETAEEPEIKLPTSTGSLIKQQSSRKTYTFALLTMPKPLTMWITRNCEKFLKKWEYQTTWLASWEICMRVKKQQLEPNMKQLTDYKSRKEKVKAV